MVSFPVRIGVPLLSLFNLRRHQPDLVDARALGDIDRLRHGLEWQLRVALDENHALGAGLKNLFQAGLELVPGDGVLVQLEALVLVSRSPPYGPGRAAAAADWAAA